MYYDNINSDTNESVDIITSTLRDYPYFVLRQEITNGYDLYKKEIARIKNYYLQYRRGVRFNTEGTSGDYVASNIRFRESATLINKQARFMFSRSPDIFVHPVNLKDEDEKDISEQYQKLIDSVLKKSKFNRRLLESAKDCLIGCRVACLIDMSEYGGIKVHFYNSLQFYYEMNYGEDELTKFVSFELINRSSSNMEKRYLVNRYVKENEKVTMSSILYDGMGKVIEEVIPEKEIDLNYIPAVIIVNDGLLEDVGGVSDMEDLSHLESGYSRLANSDIDSERKGMNPIRYTVDMNPNTTDNLPSGAGAYWDLQTNQNMDNAHPSVGTLAPQMNHTEAVKTTLDRIKTSMYQAVDVPNISEETMVGSITSGKALEALYYPLSVRCDEKLKTWIPALEFVASTILDYAKLSPDFVTGFYTLEQFADIQVRVKVQQHYALLADETEEKNIDLSEIMNNTRSRKSYLKKWRKEEFPTDDEVQEELMQIAVELTMFDTMSPNAQVQSELDRQETGEIVDDNLEKRDTQTKLENNLGNQAGE